MTRYFHIHWLCLLVALSGVSSMTKASGSISQENRWFRLPATIFMSLFEPQSLDKDRDGLKDDYENRLADAWRPAFIFDEEENALQSFEPVVLFRVFPTSDWNPGQEAKKITIKYAFLWQKDGGYEGSMWWETDAHWGDNGSGSYELISNNGVDWYLDTINLWDGYGHLQANNAKIEWTGVRNTYWGKMDSRPSPKLYFSSGKHHRYLSKAECEDDGPWHGFEDEDCDEGGQRIAQLTKDGAFNNVGEPKHHPQNEGLNRPFVNDLTPLGYKDEYVWYARWQCYCESAQVRKDCFTGGIGKRWPGELACVEPSPVYELISKDQLPGKKLALSQKDVAILLSVIK